MPDDDAEGADAPRARRSQDGQTEHTPATNGQMDAKAARTAELAEALRANLKRRRERAAARADIYPRLAGDAAKRGMT